MSKHLVLLGALTLRQLAELALWWQQFIHADDAEREELVLDLGKEGVEVKKPRRKRKPVRRKPAADQA